MGYEEMAAGFAVAPVLVAVLALGGCGNPVPVGARSGGATEATRKARSPGVPSSSAPPSNTPTLPPGRTEKEANDLYQFAYAYPDAAAAIPALRRWLDRKLDDARATLRTSSQTDKADAAASQRPYHPHSGQTEWKVVANLPDFLSLSAQDYAYEGGAHGNTAFEALVWDRRADIGRNPLAFFTSKNALRAAIRPAFCDALDKQRALKRGEPVQRNSADTFSSCIDPVAETVILGSSNGRTFDRIGVLVAPYDAAPYAEGSYDVTVPVTAAVMAALLPQYRAAFSPGA